ncbi:hypothetical protein NDU88_001776 [Pleurodeles waltl]|uniref:Uncharacterized protein n=1 Tax=Pleurodeles waltl TaxID=8319 RepID=A0AAV7Q433_PLEWA|nr:hypothetical protein NDU88_001776 [Pleurodeles waltl]
MQRGSPRAESAQVPPHKCHTLTAVSFIIEGLPPVRDTLEEALPSHYYITALLCNGDTSKCREPCCFYCNYVLLGPARNAN